MIIEVKSPFFFINKKDPAKVSYASNGVHSFEEWRAIQVCDYQCGLPQPKDGEILYQLKDYDYRGYLLKNN